MIEKIKNYLYPIKNTEMVFIIKTSLLLFFSIFNNSIVRNIQETLIDTTEGGGVELIPYLKGVFVPISTILFFALYKTLIKFFSRDYIFYIIYLIFLMYFFLFTFCIHHTFFLENPSNFIVFDGSFLSVLFSIMNIIDVASFFVVAELWGNVTISLFFWQFINSSIKKKTLKEFTLF